MANANKVTLHWQKCFHLLETYASHTGKELWYDKAYRSHVLSTKKILGAFSYHMASLKTSKPALSYPFHSFYLLEYDKRVKPRMLNGD